MRDLFRDKLPVGDGKEIFENYFNEVEKLIYTTELQDESFVDEPERDYKYFSTHLLEQRARAHQLQSLPQDVDSTPSPDGQQDEIPDQCGESEPVPHVPELP